MYQLQYEEWITQKTWIAKKNETSSLAIVYIIFIKTVLLAVIDWITEEKISKD